MIVQAGVQHLSIIACLNEQFHLDMPGFCWDREDWISRQIEQGDFWLLLGDDQDNQVTGALCLKHKPDDELHILTLAVSPRGEGRGACLVEFAKQRAVQLDCARLTVDSFEEYGLLDFYQGQGFEVVGTTGPREWTSYSFVWYTEADTHVE